jgi:hypothetical protein
MGEGKIVARTQPAGTPTWVRDATLNDSDKSFTVPANKRWYLKAIHMEVAATATVGNRLMTVTFSNGTNNIWSSLFVGPTAAQTGVMKLFPNAQDSSTVGVVSTLTPNNPNTAYKSAIPEMVLPAGSIIRAYDTAAIDAAADDMIVILHYEELDV